MRAVCGRSVCRSTVMGALLTHIVDGTTVPHRIDLIIAGFCRSDRDSPGRDRDPHAWTSRESSRSWPEHLARCFAPAALILFAVAGAGSDWFDARKRIRQQPIGVGDLACRRRISFG